MERDPLPSPLLPKEREPEAVDLTVAQTASLLYREVPIRRAWAIFKAVGFATVCRLEVGDTAG